MPDNDYKMVRRTIKKSQRWSSLSEEQAQAVVALAIAKLKKPRGPFSSKQVPAIIGDILCDERLVQRKQKTGEVTGFSIKRMTKAQCRRLLWMLIVRGLA